jgi:hypothetical protein
VRTAFLFLSLALIGSAQTPSKSKTTNHPTKQSTRGAPLSARGSNFVTDVVNAAVALPVGDQQDRLRVLNSALNVIGRRDAKRAHAMAQEAIGIEAQLISSGQEPAVSALASGFGNCTDIVGFVQQVYAQNLHAAEQSLIGALGQCPREATPLIQSKLDTAIERNQAPPRLMMATIDAVGISAPWSREKFKQLFSSLPSDPKLGNREAPNYAAMYNELAKKVSPDDARDSGLKLLEWLGKLDESPERSLAIKITSGAMNEALGEEGARTALERNVMARQAVENPGERGEIAHEEEELASGEDATKGLGKDQTESLKDLPASLRARQAAANGFAEGTAGDKQAASRYFDIAFAAIDELWSKRNEDKSGRRAAEVVEEVAEAAAHVDTVNALKRAQGLQEPASQAIGMIAVARVASSQAKADEESPRPR